MKKEKKSKSTIDCCSPGKINKACDAVYGMGLIGSLFYFWQHSMGFGGKIFALVKAVLWPAFTVYELLDFLKM